MDKKSRGVLIAFVPILVILMGLLGCLYFAHHGNLACYRLTSSNVNISTSEVYKENKLATEESSNGYSFSSYSLRLDDYSSYQELALAISQEDPEINSDFFTSASLLIISREGSYFGESQINSSKLSSAAMTIKYYIEGDQVINDVTNVSGVYYIDFLKIAKNEKIDKVIVSDYLC